MPCSSTSEIAALDLRQHFVDISGGKLMLRSKADRFELFAKLFRMALAARAWAWHGVYFDSLM